MTHWFDRLSRTAADTGGRPVTRRGAIRMAAAAAAATPLAAGVRPRVARAQPPARAAQTPCQDCKRAVVPAHLRRARACLERTPWPGWYAVSVLACLMEAQYRKVGDRFTCQEVCKKEGVPLPGISDPGYPPSAFGGCPSGTSECPRGSTSLCCYGNHSCCPCANAPGGYTCCVPEVGCACCG